MGLVYNKIVIVFALCCQYLLRKFPFYKKALSRTQIKIVPDVE